MRQYMEDTGPVGWGGDAGVSGVSEVSIVPGVSVSGVSGVTEDAGGAGGAGCAGVLLREEAGARLRIRSGGGVSIGPGIPAVLS